MRMRGPTTRSLHRVFRGVLLASVPVSAGAASIRCGGLTQQYDGSTDSGGERVSSVDAKGAPPTDSGDGGNGVSEDVETGTPIDAGSDGAQADTGGVPPVCDTCFCD